MFFRRAFLAVLSTALLLGLGWGCSTADNAGDPNPSGGGSNGLTDAGNDRDLIMVPGAAQDSGQLAQNPLCRNQVDDNMCVPDFPSSCNPFTPHAVSDGDASAEAAAGAQADATGEGGTAGGSASSMEVNGAGQGGASGAAGEAGAAGAAGAGGATDVPAVTPPKYGCQVQRSTKARNSAFSACALAGPGDENAPCFTASDCRAGLGCVGDQNAGLCQKYCCQDANDCDPGSYCAERPMRDATINALAKGESAGRAALLIPVCVHAENCDLGAPYPCPKGSACACPTDTACLVVRSDGTTTCAVPGTGKVGEACPCAWGHVCSAATNQCLKLCYTRDSESCGTGKCQAASELPEGWGVCIGVTPSGG